MTNLYSHNSIPHLSHVDPLFYLYQGNLTVEIEILRFDGGAAQDDTDFNSGGIPLIRVGDNEHHVKHEVGCLSLRLSIQDGRGGNTSVRPPIMGICVKKKLGKSLEWCPPGDHFTSVYDNTKERFIISFLGPNTTKTYQELMDSEFCLAVSQPYAYWARDSSEVKSCKLQTDVIWKIGHKSFHQNTLKLLLTSSLAIESSQMILKDKQYEVDVICLRDGANFDDPRNENCARLKSENEKQYLDIERLGLTDTSANQIVSKLNAIVWSINETGSQVKEEEVFVCLIKTKKKNENYQWMDIGHYFKLCYSNFGLIPNAFHFRGNGDAQVKNYDYFLALCSPCPYNGHSFRSCRIIKDEVVWHINGSYVRGWCCPTKLSTRR
jgi:hypothetical protein